MQYLLIIIIIISLFLSWQDYKKALKKAEQKEDITQAVVRFLLAVILFILAMIVFIF